MKFEINIEESKLEELVSEYLVQQVLAQARSNGISSEAYFGMRIGVDKAVKEYIYSNKEKIIERVIERASNEIIKKGLPKLIKKLGE